MAAQLAGEAAIRIVPSLRNFRDRVQNELSRKPMKFDIEIKPKVDTSLAKAQLEKFRAQERADAINLKARVDISEAKAAFSRVEHIFKRSAVSRAIRLNIVVLGGDAVYSAVAALGSLSAAADTAVKSLVALPGAFASMGVAAGVFAASVSGLKAAFKGLADDQKNSAQNARDLGNAQRDAKNAHEDVARAINKVGDAYRDAKRDIQDLNHEVRRGSLDEADALLNLSESMDTLRAGGFKNLNEFRRAQLGVMQSYDDLGQVQERNKRNQEDLNQANKEGINNNDKVVSALSALADAQGRVADTADRMAKSNESKGGSALAALAPEMQDFVRTVDAAQGKIKGFQKQLQSGFFSGQSANFIQTLDISLKNLGPSLKSTAEQLGGVFKDLGATLRSNGNQDALQGIIGNTNAGLATLRRGIDPLVTGLLRISDSSAFPSLAGWLVKLIDRWDAWTQKIKDSGELDEWVQNGIKGLDSLVNTGINLVTFIGSVADAWRGAGGEASGIIGSAEKLSEKLKNWGQSQAGANSMINYFRDVREFVGRVVDAFKNMGPLLSSISDLMRQWSGWMLTVVGAAAQLTEWVQEHTGLVKILLALYVSFRTVAPIWGALTTAGKNYTKVVQGLGTAGVPVFSQMNNGIKQLHSNMDALKGKTSSVIDPTKKLTVAQTNQAKALSASFTGTNNLTKAFSSSMGPMNSWSGAVGTATSKVGVGVGAGLRGAVGGLAAFLGPTAAFAAAMYAGMWAVNKLGEAHRNAARDADTQRAALDQLKQSLDGVTGSATAATQLDTAKSANKYTIPNFPGGGDRNIYQDLAKTGVATPEQLVAATNPVNTQQRTDMLTKLDNQTQAKIEASPEWERGKDYWTSHGVDAHTLAMAANGDKSAVAKVQAVEKQLFDPHGTGNTGDRTFQDSRRAGAGIQDLSAVIASSGSYESSSVGIFVRDRAGAATSGGAQIQADNQTAFGKWRVKPGDNAFGPDARAYYDGTTYKVETSGQAPPNWAENFNTETGQAIILRDGRGQVTLTPEAARAHLESYAGGGLIHGKGTGTSDSNVINASLGEYIIRKRAVDAIGVHNLDAINGYDGGGATIPLIPGPVPQLQLPAVTPPAATTFPNGAPFFPTIGQRVAGLPPLAPGATPGSLIAQNQIAPTGPTPYSTLDRLHGVDGAVRSGPADYYKSAYPNRPPVAPPAPPKPPVVPVKPTTPPQSDSTTVANHQGTGAPLGPVAHHNGAQGVPTLPGSTYTGVNGYSAPGPTQTTGAVAPAVTGYMPGVAGGVPAGPLMQGRFSEAGLQKNTVATLRAIEQAFPQISDIGGVRPDALKWHPEGLALDVMIPGQGGLNDPTTPEGKALGDQIWAWANAHSAELGIDMNASLWQQKDHFNHIHLATTGGGYPDGSEQYNFSGDAGIPGLAGLGIPGLTGSPPPGAITGGSGGKEDKNPFSQANIDKFLGGQAQNVGSSLTSIGLQFLQGMTGLDLSGLASAGQDIGNFALDKNKKDDSQSPFDSQIAGDLSQYANASSLSGLPGLGTGQSMGPGVDQWDDTIQQVLATLAAQGLISESEIPAYANAIKRQMKFETGGQNIDNPKDSDGQPALGLMQFKQGTFNAHVPAGFAKDPHDPAAAIAAAVMYSKSKGGPSYMTGKHGYARGGRQMAGPIRVSNGEYKMGGPAVAKYGLGFMNQLNGYVTGGPIGVGSGAGAASHKVGNPWRDQILRNRDGHEMIRDAMDYQAHPKRFAGGGSLDNIFGHEVDEDWSHSILDQNYGDYAFDTPMLNARGGLIRGFSGGGHYDEDTWDWAQSRMSEFDPLPFLVQNYGGQGGNALGNRNGGLIRGFAGGGMPFMPPIAPPPPAPFTIGPAPQTGPPAPGAPAPVTGPGVPGAPTTPGGPLPGPAPTPPPPPPVMAPPPMQMQLPPPPPPPPLINNGAFRPDGSPVPGGGVPGQPTLTPEQLSMAGIPGVAPSLLGAEDPNAPHVAKDAAAPEVNPEDPNPDMRSLLTTLGPAPANKEHLNPGIKAGIEGGFNQAGSIAGQAAGMALSAGTMGAGSPASGAASAATSAMFQIAGQAVSGAFNALGAAGLGSIDQIGSQATPSGAPLVPQRAPMEFGKLPSQYEQQPTQPAAGGGGGPAIVNNYNGGIHTQNMDQWQRTQQRLMDQQSQPYISKYP